MPPGIWKEIGLARTHTHTHTQLLALRNSPEFKFSLEKGSVNINSLSQVLLFFLNNVNTQFQHNYRDHPALYILALITFITGLA